MNYLTIVDFAKPPNLYLMEAGRVQSLCHRFEVKQCYRTVFSQLPLRAPTAELESDFEHRDSDDDSDNTSLQSIVTHVSVFIIYLCGMRILTLY